MLMLQPTLYAFGFNGPPEPVLLDVSSIAADRILLLDAYFYIVVFHGSTVAQWRKARYQDQPEHAAFKALLEAPQEEAHSIINRRFPTPRFTDCDHNGSQASTRGGWGRGGAGWGCRPVGAVSWLQPLLADQPTDPTGLPPTNQTSFCPFSSTPLPRRRASCWPSSTRAPRTTRAAA